LPPDRPGVWTPQVSIRPTDGFLLDFKFTPTYLFNRIFCQLQDASGRPVLETRVSAEKGEPGTALWLYQQVVQRPGSYSLVVLRPLILAPPGQFGTAFFGDSSPPTLAPRAGWEQRCSAPYVWFRSISSVRNMSAIKKVSLSFSSLSFRVPWAEPIEREQSSLLFSSILLTSCGAFRELTPRALRHDLHKRSASQPSDPSPLTTALKIRHDTNCTYLLQSAMSHSSECARAQL